MSYQGFLLATYTPNWSRRNWQPGKAIRCDRGKSLLSLAKGLGKRAFRYHYSTPAKHYRETVALLSPISKGCWGVQTTILVRFNKVPHIFSRKGSENKVIRCSFPSSWVSVRGGPVQSQDLEDCSVVTRPPPPQCEWRPSAEPERLPPPTCPLCLGCQQRLSRKPRFLFPPSSNKIPPSLGHQMSEWCQRKTQ